MNTRKYTIFVSGKLQGMFKHCITHSKHSKYFVFNQPEHKVPLFSAKVGKTKERAVDFRKRQQWNYTPVEICRTPVERVASGALEYTSL